MRKSLFIIPLAIVIFFISSCAFFTTSTACTSHYDNNGDLLCDGCGARTKEPACNSHKDKDHDGICDTDGCDEELIVTHSDPDHDGICNTKACKREVEVVHSDDDGDGICDGCSLILDEGNDEDENGNTQEKNECEECVDKNYDNSCDKCGKDVLHDGIDLIVNGELTCSMVVADGLSYYEIKAIRDLADRLIDLGYYIDLLEDDESNITDGVEILVGDVKSRGEKYAISSHDFGLGGYAVKCIDNKILVLGGSESTFVVAVNHLMKNGFGITSSTRKLKDAKLLYEDQTEKITTYTIDDVTVGGESIRGHVIACDKEYNECELLAKSIQTSLYKYAGIWLPIIDKNELSDENYVSVEIREKSGGVGFYITADGRNLTIASEFKNKLISEAESYFDGKLIDVVGTVILDSKTVNVRDVNYEMFGACGDGREDDSASIRACHKYANEYGHNVVLNSGKTYYIGPLKSTIYIKTNVNFGDAHFIIDDRDISSSSAYRSVSIFTVASYYASLHYNHDDNDFVKAINESGGIKAGETAKLDLGLGYPALIKIKNSNHKTYIRYGANANDGADQSEIVLIDENGNVDKDTPFIFDYETVTDIYIFRADLEPMTLEGGTFTQRANQCDSDNKAFNRNIAINRSNLTVKDLTYEITDEREGDYEGNPYNSFLRVEYGNDVLFYNCRLDAHKTYYKPGTTVGMGSKSINATSSNNVRWEKCVQTNLFTDESETELTKGLWGIMSSNYSKNLAFIDSTLSRFDAHSGIYNATVKGCRITSVRIVGYGLLKIEDCEVFAPNTANTFISSREDYGSFWKGTISVKNVHMHTVGSGAVNFIAGHWYNHYFGYTTALADEIIIDNFTTDSDSEVKLFSDTFVKELNASLTAESNVNPIAPVKKVTIKNSENTVFKLPDKTLNPFFKDTEFIIKN